MKDEIEMSKFKSVIMVSAIKEEMQNQNVSIRFLAKEMMVARNTLMSWLHCETSIPLWAVLYIVDYLGLGLKVEKEIDNEK